MPNNNVKYDSIFDGRKDADTVSFLALLRGITLTLAPAGVFVLPTEYLDAGSDT
jgi:hypothetical protein